MMEKLHYIEENDRLVVETIYDPTDTIEQNAQERQDASSVTRYKPQFAGLVKVASIPEEHIVALKNKGYNLLSPDQNEVRRALMYVQQHEPHWLTVGGKPFAMHRPRWR